MQRRTSMWVTLEIVSIYWCWKSATSVEVRMGIRNSCSEVQVVCHVKLGTIPRVSSRMSIMHGREIAT